MRQKLQLSIPSLRLPKTSRAAVSRLANSWSETAHSLKEKTAQRLRPDLSAAQRYRGARLGNDLADRLLLPTMSTSPELEASDAIAHAVYNHITKKDWDGLCDYLEGLDESRCAVPSGRRHLEMAMFFVRRAMSQTQHGPDDSSLETYYAINRTSLRQLSAAQEQLPDDYMLSALKARLHIDCGWVARGSTTAQVNSDAARSALYEHFEIARKAVADFDPFAENSPLLAEIQYRLHCGTTTEEGLISEAFHDWLELDPTNMAPYRAHAFQLVQFHDAPRTRLEVAAQRAVAIGGNAFGSSAYCVMYLEALRLCPKPYETLNANLFLESLEDLIVHYQANPIRVSDLIQDTYQVFGDPGHGMHAELNEVETEKLRKIQAALPEIFSAYVSAFCPFAWDGSLDLFLAQIAPAFSQELSRGDKIQLSKDGAQILDR